MPYAELTRTGLGRKGAKQIPNAKLVEIENSGHIPPFAAREKFHTALLEFLQGKQR
jgi:pimeloyl-ACP methyl ester carboxylesterase